jgi:hypothetical protein
MGSRARLPCEESKRESTKERGFAKSTGAVQERERSEPAAVRKEKKKRNEREAQALPRAMKSRNRR